MRKNSKNEKVIRAITSWSRVDVVPARRAEQQMAAGL